MQRAYRDLFNRQPDMEVYGIVDSAETALEELPESADIVIIDVSLKGMDGIALVRHLKTTFPHIRTLIISGHERAVYAERAREAGADGYVMKINSHLILSTVRQILSLST